jgi:hypothetical protein
VNSFRDRCRGRKQTAFFDPVVARFARTTGYRPSRLQRLSRRFTLTRGKPPPPSHASFSATTTIRAGAKHREECLRHTSLQNFSFVAFLRQPHFAMAAKKHTLIRTPEVVAYQYKAA